MIRIIGYGSLMIPESLQKTISLRPFQLVWVEGYKRIANIRTRFPKQYGVKPGDNHVSILNVEEEDGGRLNAVAFDVSEDELEKLKIREQIYYVKEVELRDFATSQPAGTGLLFIGKKLFHGERIVSDEYLPISSYCQKCREAAYALNKEFGKAFDETTFAADGRLLREYLGAGE